MIDLHCHILPGIDDGPERMEESVAMARMAVADGISTIVATPHVKDELYPPDYVSEQVRLFRAVLKAADVPLEICAGGDVNALMDPTLLSPYTINGTPYILFEFPHTHVPRNAAGLLFNAILAGFRPIITHPERNPSFIRDPGLLSDLVAGGALVQVTAASLLGTFGRKSKQCGIQLLRKGLVHFLASDAHSCRHRPPGLSQAVAVAEKEIGRKAALDLVTSNPAAVLAGRQIYI